MYNTIFTPKEYLRNDLFQPGEHVQVRNRSAATGRMAFVVSLEDEDEDASDIPTTLIRSKMELTSKVEVPAPAPCPDVVQSSRKESMSDIVVNKLIDIMAGIRMVSVASKNCTLTSNIG